MPMSSPVVPPLCHAIGFFENQQQLCVDIAGFVEEGLRLNQPALVVTTDAHRDGIAGELRGLGVDVDAVSKAGDLMMLDAEETLLVLMNGGQLPDSSIYHQSVGSACERLLRGRPGPLRIFGDMVDVLWQREQYDAAIRIEILSNQLAATYPISVICGYSMGHFLKSASRLETVTTLHGRLHRSKATLDGSEPQARAYVSADRGPRSTRSARKSGLGRT
jgi:hypothetical protein